MLRTLNPGSLAIKNLFTVLIGILMLGIVPVAADEIIALGKCLDVDHQGTANGTRVQLWSCNQTKAQNWIHIPRTGEIRGMAGKCLDVQNGDTDDYTPVQLWECNGTKAQQWWLADGEIRGLAGKCLDVYNADTRNGTQVQIVECNGTAAQRWRIAQ
ncbi:ricin-type beta-trefoil lectin domain protein [Chitinimonas sp.]|uniref:ricin-type beta-trefoil lectin domain protein n=1 Tax=Chitinimonas sp. TaxID=1934313 RepID=UPI0035AF4715